MKNRQQRMDEFLKYIAAIYDQHPNIYGTLTRYEVTAMSKQKEPLKSFFSNWIEHFRGYENISVFVSENWKYFCQFKNGNFLDMAHCAIKIYIPLDLRHIEAGAKQIFEFIESKGYNHSSKIGSDERIDNIVIRVESSEIANEIIQFVNSNGYISEGLMKPNPFGIPTGNICCVADGFLSFNNVLSEYINDYMHFHSKSSAVGIEHFRSFVYSRYNDYFVNGKYLSFLENSKSDNLSSFNGDITALLVNYQQITELILRSTDSAFKIDDFSEHLDELVSEKRSNNKYNYLKSLQNKKLDSNTEKINPETVIVVDNSIKLNILKDIVRVNFNKYGLVHTINALKQFLDEGKVKGFTRDNASRDKINQFSSQDILSLIKEYLGQEFNQATFVEDFVKKSMMSNYLMEACYATYQKYGEKQSIGALVKFIDENKADSFTNDNSARINLINNVSSIVAKGEILKVLFLNGVTLDMNNTKEIAIKYIDFIVKEFEATRLVIVSKK